MAASKTSSRTIEAAEHRKKALEMRLFGMTYRKIANNLAVSVSAVHKAVDKGGDALHKGQKIATEKVKTMDLDRLEQDDGCPFPERAKGERPGHRFRFKDHGASRQNTGTGCAHQSGINHTRRERELPGDERN